MNRKRDPDDDEVRKIRREIAEYRKSDAYRDNQRRQLEAARVWHERHRRGK